jgi:hypothetical protein
MVKARVELMAALLMVSGSLGDDSFRLLATLPPASEGLVCENLET